jgi:murein DD-endopeptidase MepM/ murein hydrolase activator NlpD
MQHVQPTAAPSLTRRAVRLAIVLAIVLAGVLATATLPTATAATSVTAATGVNAVIEEDQAPWSWPVAFPRSIQRPFEAPATPYSSGHRGIDITASFGTPVMAPATGTIYFSGRVVDRGVVTIAHDGGYLSSFEPVVSDLEAGQRVTAGQVIGAVDAGGHCNDACLHFGVRLDGEYLSPLMMIGEVPRAVLLPLG